MSDTTEAFADLLDAQEEAIGERLKATVGAVAGKDAIVSELTFDEIIAAGGMAEGGGFSLQMRGSDFSQPPREKVDKVTARGKTLTLQTAVLNNGIFYLQAYDPVASE